MKCLDCQSPISSGFRYCSQCGNRLPPPLDDPTALDDDGDRISRLGNGYFAHAPYGVFTVDERGKYVEVNPALCRITGYDADELTRLTIADMLPFESREHGLNAFQQLLKLGRYEGDFPFVKKSGAKGWCAVSAVKLAENQILGMIADITSRKELEETLVRTRARLQFVVRASLVVFYSCRPVKPFGTTFVSENMTELLGYAPEEFLSDKDFWFDRIHRADRDRLIHSIERLKRPGHHTFEYRLRHKNGTWRWVRDDMTLVRDDSGKPLEIIGALYDITHSKHAEVELRASEERYRNFVEHATDAFFLHGKDGVIRDVNASAAAGLGYTREELVGAQVAFFDSAATPELMASLSARLGSGETVVFDSTHRRKDGTTFPVEVRIRGFESHGEFLAISLVRDISNRVQTEAALRESEERLRLALASANQGLWDLNIETGTGIVSPEYATTLGYDPDDFVETIESLLARMHPDDVAHTLRAYEAYLRGESSTYRVEFRQKTADGDWKWILSCGKIIERSGEGRPLRMLGTHTDISASKNAEAQLRLVNAAIDRSINGVAIAGVDGRLSYVNRAFLDMWGYEHEHEVIGRSPSQFWVEPHRAAAIMRTLLERDSFIGELTAVRRNGSTFDVQLSATSICDAEGKFTHMTGSFIDITESKRQREALVRSESRLSEAQRIAKIGSWELDLLHNRLSWSNEAYRIFGVDEETFTPSYEAVLNAVHPDDRHLVEDAYTRSLVTREPYQVSHRLCRPDGSIGWVTERCVSHFDEEGRPYRSVGTVQDVTEQKRVEEQLIAAHQRLREILDSLFGFVGVCTTEGILVEINRAPLEATGLARDDVLGKPVWDLPWNSFSADNQNDLRDAIVRAATGEFVRREIQALTGDGTLISIDTNFGPLRDLDGTITHVIGFGVDISPRKRAEEKMANLRDELAHVHRMGVMGELASGLAHELNQPLTALALYASTALVLAENVDSVPLQSTLAKISEQSLRAGQIISGMRSFVNRDRSLFSETSIEQTVQDALRILEYDLKHEEVDIRLDLDDALPLVRANGIQIMQVLVNLIRNAIEAMTNLPATERRLTIRAESTGDGVRLAVTDTGCGFDETAARTIFHPFKTSKPVGMGMGLAISRKLIEAHGGKIEAESAPGQGSTFVVCLPFADAPPLSSLGREEKS